MNNTFYLACQNGDISTVTHYLNNKINVNLNNGKALITAVKYEKLEIVELLHQHGANLNIQDGEALNLAIDSGQYKITQYLIQNGAIISKSSLIDVNTNIVILELLLENGADINLCDEFLLEFPCERGFIDIIKLILKYGFKNRHGQPLLVASKNKHWDIVNLLIDEGFDLFIEDGLVLLNIIWGCNDDTTLVQKVLDKGIKPNIHDNRPIDVACKLNHINVIKILLKYNAKPNKETITNLEKERQLYIQKINSIDKVLDLF